MENKITKKRITQHLEYDWYKYLVILLVSIVFWVLLYYYADKAKLQYRLDVYCIDITADIASVEKLTNDFERSLRSRGDYTINDINIQNVRNDFFLYSMLDTYFKDGDIVIADEDMFRLIMLRENGNYLLPLSDLGDGITIGKRHIKGSVLDGLTVIEGDKTEYINNYLDKSLFGGYYVFDQTQYEKAKEQDMYPDMPDEDKQKLIGKIYGIELNSIGSNILFKYDGEKKYYLGIIYHPDYEGGGNKGIFNGINQPVSNKQAFEFINNLCRNYKRYTAN